MRPLELSNKDLDLMEAALQESIKDKLIPDTTIDRAWAAES